MHDPKTLAFEIYLGRQKKKNGNYRSPFVTIWHKDPETDGTDDSCGWHIRLRHADKDVFEKIVKEFKSEWDNTYTSDTGGRVYYNGWFNPYGDNILSVRGIVFNMYLYAAKIVLSKRNGEDPRGDWKRAWKFMDKFHMQIEYFAENCRDSMRDVIVRKYERQCDVPYDEKTREEMIRNCAAIVYTDILNKTRKWYNHPRWHIRHWSIQFHPFLRIN